MVDTDLEHLSGADQMFAEAGGVREQSSLDRIARGKRHYNGRRWAISSRGALGKNATRAWVYVATNDAGRVKIGMTALPEKRASDLQVVLRMALEVPPAAAQVIETEALRLLGSMAGDSEWVPVPLPEAMAAVWRARDFASRSMRVDLSLTDDDARLLRLGLAK